MTVAKLAPPRRSQATSHAPDAPRRRRVPTAAATAIEPDVVDDLPETVPVSVSELNVIETYLGSVIDNLLTGAAAEPLETPSSMTILRTPSRVSRTRP
jgi:hypothetical protein